MAGRTQDDRPYQAQYRRTITEEKAQLELPRELVVRVGQKSQLQGAVTYWYYDESDGKLLLADDSFGDPAVRKIEGRSLQGLTNQDLMSGSVTPTRVTLPKEIPEEVHGELRSDSESIQVVLKPADPGSQSFFVSVYNARKYDNGDLPNVTRTQKPRGSSSGHDNCSGD